MDVATPETAVCKCKPDNGCDGEGYDADDPRVCVFCRGLDGDLSCPADPTTHEPTIEWVMKVLRGFEVDGAVIEPVVACADGTEPFASLNLGHGLFLDLTAKVRRTNG